ncbi:MAG: hypothetical protein KDB26_02115 [Microthrixaceae bacterium]|nr:hypothetical protein [Microthrixaceae bacterium]
MPQRRYYNPHLPQTLVIAQILLYMNAVFGALDVLQVSLDTRVSYSGVGKLILIASVAAQVFGAYGVANERKVGYQIAVLASFMPLIGRIISVIQVGASISGNLRFILLGGSILNVLFEYALIALLLHPMSANHQKVWFR